MTHKNSVTFAFVCTFFFLAYLVSQFRDLGLIFTYSKLVGELIICKPKPCICSRCNDFLFSMF